MVFQNNINFMRAKIRSIFAILYTGASKIKSKNSESSKNNDKGNNDNSDGNSKNNNNNNNDDRSDNKLDNNRDKDGDHNNNAHNIKDEKDQDGDIAMKEQEKDLDYLSDIPPSQSPTRDSPSAEVQPPKILATIKTKELIVIPSQSQSHDPRSEGTDSQGSEIL